MKIGFHFETGQPVELTVEQGGQDQSDRVDLWARAHRAFDGLAGRVNVIDAQITDAQAGKLVPRRDGKVTLNLLAEESPGEIELSLPGNRKGIVRTLDREQQRGWGAGEYYMLPVDDQDRVVFEPGERHRKVYMSGSDQAMDQAAIAAHAGVAADAVTGAWLVDHPDYGATPDMPVTEDVGRLIFNHLIGDSRPSRSDWYLYERGYAYQTMLTRRMMRGESELHPLVIAAWGSGARPKFASSFSFTGYGPKFMVVQGIDMAGFALKENYCTIVEDYAIRHHESQASNMAMVTMRNGRHNDCWLSQPNRAVDDEVWEPSANRFGAFYSADSNGLLIERCLFDHSGWAEGYDFNLSVDYPQPPSGLSHNLYLDYHTYDVTMRDSITSRGASFGAMYRGGATVDNVLFLDNNIAFNTLGGDYQNRGPVGQYSTIRDSVCISSGYKQHAPSVTTSKGTWVNGRPGAYNWGMDSDGCRTSLMGNIVCHRANPDDPAEQAAKPTGGFATRRNDTLLFDDSIVYRWNATNENIGGLDPAALDQVTMQRYAGQLLGKDSATIGEFNDYARDPDKAVIGVLEGSMRFLRGGFGLDRQPRTQAAECVFLPDPRGEGFRWDNRLNWSTQDRPGQVAGDIAALDGNEVRFGSLTTRLAGISFGGGHLDVTSGLLAAEGTQDAGRVTIRNSGQFHLQGTDQPLSVLARNGRLNLTGAVADLDLVAAGKAQALLGPDCHVPAGRTLRASGSLVRLGWDGTGPAHLELAGGLDLCSGLLLKVEGGANRYLREGVRVTGRSSGFTATVGDYEKFVQYRVGEDVLWLYDIQGSPQIGEQVHYHTLVENLRNDGPEPLPEAPSTITELFVEIASVVEYRLPGLAPFRSGMHGTQAPSVSPSVSLSGPLSLNLRGLGAGSYPLIAANILGNFSRIDVQDLAPDLNAAISVTPQGVDLHLTAGSGQVQG